MSEKFFKCAGCGATDYGPMYRLGLCHECWMTRAYAGEFDDEPPAESPKSPEVGCYVEFTSNGMRMASKETIRQTPAATLFHAAKRRETPKVSSDDPERPQRGENEWVTYVE